MKIKIPAKLKDTERNKYTDRAEFLFAAKKLVQEKERNLLTHEELRGEVVFELMTLCKTLYSLAQKYVPHTPAAFHDFSAFLQVSNKLQRLGMQLTLDPRVAAKVKATDNSAVTSSLEYRMLRNKFIAALTTIADLTLKPENEKAVPENGYQRGVREGYRRASEVAILFLDDVQTAENL